VVEGAKVFAVFRAVESAGQWDRTERKMVKSLGRVCVSAHILPNPMDRRHRFSSSDELDPFKAGEFAVAG